MMLKDRDLCRILFSGPALLGFIAILSFGALAAALIAEAFLELEPCRLCIYQRYPFMFGMAFGITGIVFRRKPALVLALIKLCAVTFLMNAGIAFYHTGVEQHWWKSVFAECSVTQIFRGKDIQSLLENIMSAPAARCDEIPWQDPIIGLSMANYNVVLCLWLAILCVSSLMKNRRYSESSVSQ